MNEKKLKFKKKIIASNHSEPGNDPTDEELAVLKKYFGFNQFRDGQWRIIKTLLREGRDVCGILATGQGKSLCYQFPAVLKQKTVLVVSPLISLMQDQKMALLAKNIPSEAMCGLTRDYLETTQAVVSGKFRVVYTTPEFINNNLGILKIMHSNGVLEMIAIDEAHCISQWGHDFRPSYRQLTTIREHLPPEIPILALTATATPAITKDICDNLDLRNVDIIRASTDRPNLRLWVEKKHPGGWLPSIKKILGEPSKWIVGGTDKNEHKNEDDNEEDYGNEDDNGNEEDHGNEDDNGNEEDYGNEDILEEDTPKKKVLGHGDSTIIYTNSRKDCENIYKDLKRVGYPVDYYHAGMGDKRRMEVHKDFIYDRTPIVVATIAFGMGIDKPSIRKIINWGLPANIETYYQEIGRAGRDGLESDCYLLYSMGDMYIHKFLIGKMEAGKQVQEHHMHLLELMRQYVTGNVCRQYQLAQYFTRENLVTEIPQDPEELDKFCGVCDNCFARKEELDSNGGYAVAEEKIEVYHEAKMMIDLVRTLSTNYGFKNLVGILAGSKAKDFPARLKRCAYYGKGDSKSQVFWRALGDILIDHGYLKYTKVGGLYGGSKWGKNSNKVFQVVTIGSKKLSGDSLKIVPSPTLKKTIKGCETNKNSDELSVGKTGELMSELKRFRIEVSVKMNLPPYMVMGDKVINNLLNERLPTDISRLALVDGINTHVIMMYGDDLVQVMNKCAPKITFVENGGTKMGLNSTQNETLELFKQGLGVKEIAKKRDMVASTIENHLMKAFATEDGLEWQRLVSPDQKEKIEKFLRDNKDKKLNKLKRNFKKSTILERNFWECFV